MANRAHLLVFACLAAAAADTGAQTNTWRQCVADTPVRAIEACTSIIFLDPTHDGAFVNRGIAQRRLGNLEHAIRDYDEAIRLNPGAADAFSNRGNAYRTLRNLSQALKDYDEAIRLNPRYAHAYNNRGIIFLELRELDHAVRDFDRALAEDPLYANAFRNRGLARTEQGLFDMAVRDFDDAFRLDPTIGHGAEYALALFGRGRRRQKTGDPRAAEDLLEARRLLPNVAELVEE
jgi:tetratricopeptide (TPR) repeat protein